MLYFYKFILMEKLNEAIQKLISVSPLVQNCYALSAVDLSTGQSQDKDLLAYLVKSTELSPNYAKQGMLKPYQHIVIFGDALMSGIYAAYAYHVLRKAYDTDPSVTLIQLDDVVMRQTAFCTDKILKDLGVLKLNRDWDDDYECPDNTLLIIPQHRSLMIQDKIIGNDLGIYTIPGKDVILGDRDLSLFYIDESVHILRRRKQHPECVEWWSEAIRQISFGDKDAYAEAVDKEIQRLISSHAPRIKQLFY